MTLWSCRGLLTSSGPGLIPYDRELWSRQDSGTFAWDASRARGPAGGKHAPSLGTRSCCLAQSQGFPVWVAPQVATTTAGSRTAALTRDAPDPTEPDSPWATEPVGCTPGGRPRALESIHGQCHQRTESAVKPGTSRVNLPRLGPAQARPKEVLQDRNEGTAHYPA